MPPRPQREITTALTKLAFYAGNYAAVVKELRKEGVSLTEATLKNWATNSHLEEFESIKSKLNDSYEEEAIANMRLRMREADQVMADAIQRVKDTIQATDSPKDAAQAAYYLSTVHKNAVEKMRLMTDRPTEIVEDRTPEAAMRSLIARRIIKPVERDSSQN